MISQSPLLRIPRELRDQIIAYVFEDIKQERVHFSRNDITLGRRTATLHKALPSVCQVSTQLYHEATLQFLGRIIPVSYDVEMTCWLRKWLATLPPEFGFRAIRQLAFRNFHGPEQIKGYELIALCPNLRKLDVMLGDEYSDPGTVPSLAIKSLSSSVNAYESLDNIIFMHQLHKLVEIPRLERLDIGFHDWEQPMSIDRARQVMEWLRVKYQAKGRTVHIKCKQMVYGGSMDVEGLAPGIFIP